MKSFNCRKCGKKVIAAVFTTHKAYESFKKLGNGLCPACYHGLQTTLYEINILQGD